MGLNKNYQEPGKTNMNYVHNYQYDTYPPQINIPPKQQYDNS